MQISFVMILFFVFLSMAIVLYGLAASLGAYYAKVLLIYLLGYFITAFLSIGLVYWFKIDNNLFLFHLFTPFEYAMLCLLFSGIIQSGQLKKTIRWSIPFFIILSAIFSMAVQQVRENNSYINIIESILLICWTLFFLKEILFDKQIRILYIYPLFWVSSGILMYFTENLVIEGLLAYMIKNSLQLARQVFSISFILKYLFFLLLAIGALCELRLHDKKLISK